MANLARKCLLAFLWRLYHTVNLFYDLLERLTGWKAFHLSFKSFISQLSLKQKDYFYHDAHITSGFRVTLEALERTNLTPCGRAFYTNGLMYHLDAGMHFRDACSTGEHSTKFRRPLYIVGLQRTGTTHLHNLLNCDNRLYCQTLAQMVPGLRLIPRNISGFIVDILAFTAFQHMHNINLHVPEDVLPIFGVLGLISPIRSGSLANDHLQKWISQLDLSTNMHFYNLFKRYLSYLQQTYNPKCSHIVINQHMPMTNLSAISRVFPDAIFINTVREPLASVASYCSMIEMSTKIAVRPERGLPSRVGQIVLHDLSSAANQFLKFRQANEGRHTFIDIRYANLTSDPLGEVEQIYRAVGLEMTQDVRSKIETHLEENKQHKHGKHIYSLSDFDLTTDEVENAFKEYKQFYKLS